MKVISKVIQRLVTHSKKTIFMISDMATGLINLGCTGKAQKGLSELRNKQEASQKNCKAIKQQIQCINRGLVSALQRDAAAWDLSERSLTQRRDVSLR